MDLDEKCRLVITAGLAVSDTESWYQKYRHHRNTSNTRGVLTELSFEQYLSKVVAGGLQTPDQIGKRKGQFVLGRVGDIGNYSVDNSRFIPTEQNHAERFENGRHLEGDKRRSEAMTGLTVETSERVRKVTEALTGRTKESHTGYQAVSKAHAKKLCSH